MEKEEENTTETEKTSGTRRPVRRRESSLDPPQEKSRETEQREESTTPPVTSRLNALSTPLRHVEQDEQREDRQITERGWGWVLLGSMGLVVSPRLPQALRPSSKEALGDAAQSSRRTTSPGSKSTRFSRLQSCTRYPSS